MKSVRYMYPRANFRRVLRPTDLERLGMINVKETLVWEPENGFTIVMNNKLSDSLVDKLPSEFIALDADGDDEAPVVLEPMTSIAQSTSGNPAGSPIEAVPNLDDDDESSTDDDDLDA